MRRLFLAFAMSLAIASAAGLGTHTESASAFTYCGTWKNSGYAYYNSGYRYQPQSRYCTDSNGLSWTQKRTISHRI